ncbi:uncharacterized protein DS421_6g174540 [Arachis hypogaea]|nr:uncharacterized protein DS421_6g174540 [Arachis hypogaea]
MAVTIGGFRPLQPVVMGSALPCHTYHSCTAAGHDVTDTAGCMPLLISWIYHRFMCFSPVGYDVARFSIAARLVRLEQQSGNRHDGKIQSLGRRIDVLTFDKE